jgi:hypothetical protein
MEYVFTEWMYKTELNLKLALIEAYFEHLKNKYFKNFEQVRVRLVAKKSNWFEILLDPKNSGIYHLKDGFVVFQ